MVGRGSRIAQRTISAGNDSQLRITQANERTEPLMPRVPGLKATSHATTTARHTSRPCKLKWHDQISPLLLPPGHSGASPYQATLPAPASCFEKQYRSPSSE
jgi:hypothetical protein